MKSVFFSKVISFSLQLIALVIGLYTLYQYPKKSNELKQKTTLLHEALILEMSVQFVQISMYIWLFYTFHLTTMAKTRYIDWYITTPIMLLSLMLYLQYEKENEKIENYKQFVDKYRNIVIGVIILNIIMLSIGLLGEFKMIDVTIASFLGFIPMIILFYLIYKHFASYSNKGRIVFITYVMVWSLYGIAYLLNEHQKNTLYNILDMFAKNVFGIFLSYKILILR